MARQVRWQGPAVVVDDPGLESPQPGGHRLAHLAHPDESDRGAVQCRPVEERAPAGEVAVAHILVRPGYLPHDPDRQADREFGSGNGQHVGQDREPHAAPGACLGVEVVVALQRRADHP